MFLDPPDSKATELELTDLPSRGGRLRLVSGPKVVRGLAHMPGRVRNWLEARWLERLERLAEVRIGTIWLFENSRFFDMRFAGSRLKIYHQVDLDQNFHPDIAAATADISFCTTELIRDRLLTKGRRVEKVHHGLAEVPVGTALAPRPEAFDGVEIQAAYIGNLDMQYIDTDLFVECVCAFPHVRFHLVGGSKNGNVLRRELEGRDNTVFWGKVSHEVIPAILEQVDIMIVLYQEAHFDDQASPHKFMEYLASGKTIVCSYTQEYCDKLHLVTMARTPGDYISAFSEVLSRLDHYNSDERKQARRSFALDHTYHRQLDRIVAHLDDAGLAHDLNGAGA